MTDKEVALFDVTETAIAELATKYMPLTINGIEDKEGYARVKAARLDVRNYRLKVDKRRKELTADAVKHQKRINAEAKRIFDLLEPIEGYLCNEETHIDQLHELERKAKEEALEAKKQVRIDTLLTLGFNFSGIQFTCSYRDTPYMNSAIQALSDADFQVFVDQAVIDYNLMFEASEKMRLMAEELAERERALKAESERLECEKAIVLDVKPTFESVITIERVDTDVYGIDKGEKDETVIHAFVPVNPFVIEIGGSFTATYHTFAQNAEEAEKEALCVLHNLADSDYADRFDFDFEQSDVEVYESNPSK